MAEMTALKCEGCGSSELIPEDSCFRCKYCGVLYVPPVAVRELLSTDRDKLLETLEKALPEVRKVEEFVDEVGRENAVLNEINGDREAKKRVKLWIVILCVVVFAAAFYNLEALVGIILGFAAGVGLEIYRGKRVDRKYTALAEHQNGVVAGVADRFNEYLKTTKYINIVPKTYRSVYIVETMLEAVRNYRADNWKECVNVYEEIKHRQTLEQNAAKQLEQQQKILEVQREIQAATKNAPSHAALDSWFK